MLRSTCSGLLFPVHIRPYWRDICISLLLVGVKRTEWSWSCVYHCEEDCFPKNGDSTFLPNLDASNPVVFVIGVLHSFTARTRQVKFSLSWQTTANPLFHRYFCFIVLNYVIYLFFISYVHKTRFVKNSVIYKVVQIWPGLIVYSLHTNQSRSYLNHLVFVLLKF